MIHKRTSFQQDWSPMNDEEDTAYTAEAMRDVGQRQTEADDGPGVEEDEPEYASDAWIAAHCPRCGEDWSDGCVCEPCEECGLQPNDCECSDEPCGFCGSRRQDCCTGHPGLA